MARIFRGRLEELKIDIIKRKFFGEVVAYTYVIEFQKRGLPHAQFLIILKTNYKIISPVDCDKFVTAEILDRQIDPLLYALCEKHMIHGPCSLLNPNCPCMMTKQGIQIPSCKNKYPKPLTEYTNFDKHCYHLYHRRMTQARVQIKGFNLDNGWVVPYNPHLLMKYDCHVNLEVCATVKSVKYIYKYIYKGHDRIGLNLSSESNIDRVDEIKQYQNARWFSPREVA